ncbi:MAG: tetratricopeptide repeat protein [Candidatus Omnitrophica bacterium]|nr:tetratricopeptide repeat protein [Candidatus Omnitrophota bacterium]
MKRLTMWLGLIIVFVIAIPAFGQQTAQEYFNKGVELYEANDYPGAATAFEKALELKTDYLESEYNLAITYWTQKNYPKAISTLESLLKKAPDSDIGKQAASDLEKLKEFRVPVIVTKTTEETEETKETNKEPDKEINVTLKSVPELIADLKFGLLAKRIAATNQLRQAQTDEAIEALFESALNPHEKLAVKGSAVQNLARIKNPKALSAVDQTLAGTSITNEEKFKLLVVLSNQNTPESFKVILKYWFLAEWPIGMNALPPNIKRKEWPSELGDPRMWTLTKKLGKEESLPLFLSAWPGIIETTDNIIPPEQRDYVFYYNLMTGFLKGDISVPVLVQRLKEDYPVPAQVASGESPPPGGYMVKEAAFQGAPGGPPPPGGPRNTAGQSTAQAAPIWTVEDEVKLRVEMIEALKSIAGESQGPFLEYLALNDPKNAVRDAASETFKSLNIRVSQSKENYNKGLKLLESGNADEAIALFEQALKENPDAPYRKNINKNLIAAGIQFLAKGNKERAASLLSPLYQLVSGVLAQETTGPMGGFGAPPGQGAADDGGVTVKKIISDQLAVLEIPSAKTQDIQNIYDLGLALGIIKKPEPAFLGAPGGPPGGPPPGGARPPNAPPPPPQRPQ